MMDWRSGLVTDPLPTLLEWDDPALAYFVRRDLLHEAVPPVGTLWELPEAKRLAGKQLADGAWPYPGKSCDPLANTNYNLLETFRTLRVLVEMYGFTKEHPALQKAAKYIFSCQTDEGDIRDIRGILGSQYIPYYHGAILELLIKAGYAGDPRLETGLLWLLSMRQDDGGWVIPAQQVPAREKTARLWYAPPVPPDRSRPHSHIATGMALRPFAVHPVYRRSPEARNAGERLKERLFRADKYNDRKGPAYWLKFQFPFWWPSLVTALDTLSRLRFDRGDAHIARGLAWFFENQAADGLWGTSYGSGRKAESMRHWVGIAICRVLMRFNEKDGVQ